VPRINLDIDTDLSPERVMGALLDFTPNRPKLWPGLNPKEYRVLEVGDTWAEIREGNGGPVWARERYDWSKPAQVTWTVMESGFSRPGSYVTASFEPRGTGTRIHVLWNRTGVGIAGRLIIALIALTRGSAVRASLNRGLKAIASQPPSPLPPGASVP
jgi:hypothetical protein